MKKVRLLFSLLIFSISCQMQPAIINVGKGALDTVAPGITITTIIPDPILDDSVLVIYTATKGPIIGLAAGEVVLTNCTETSFTQVSGNVWTAYWNPIIDGTFSGYIPAGVCTWNGISNTISNTLTRTYDSGATYDLQNAASLIKIRTRAGNVAAFIHNNDLLSTTSVPGMELLHTKYNFPYTQFANGDNAANRDMYDFGVCDFGIISITNADFDVRDALITTVRDGNSPVVGSYKNGDDSYSASLVTKSLGERNSEWDAPKSTVTSNWRTWPSASAAMSWGSSFRHDYCQKNTQSSYFSGKTQAEGDTQLATVVSDIITNAGCYSDFVHHHWQIGNYPKHYLATLSTDIGSNTVHRGTYNEVRACGIIYDIVTSVTATGNTISVNHLSYSTPSPLREPLPPFWVRIDLTGTVFAGHDIALSNGLKPYHISGNIFHIPVVMDFSGTSSTVSMGIATSAPDYVNLTVPTMNRTGSAVTSDLPCRFTVWRVPKPTSLASSVTSATIPTADNTTVNLTVATGLTIPNFTQVKVSKDGSNYFYAWVTSYTSGTGALVLSSFPDAVGSGTYSSWTIQTYYHELAATIVERSFTLATSYTIAATLDETNYTYYVGGITTDGISNVTP